MEAQNGYIAEKTDYTVANLIRELIDDDYAMGEINALKLSDIDLNGKRLFVNRSVTIDENNRTVLGETTKTYVGIWEICLAPAVLTIVKKSILEQAPNPQTLLFCDKKQRLF